MITYAKQSDLEAIYAIEKTASAYPWSKQMLQDSLSAGCQCLLTMSKNKLCGYLLFSQALDEIEILAIAVHPDCQHQGVGQTLLNELFREAKKSNVRQIYLDVRRSNKQAIRFYQKMKFKQVGIRQDYYQAGSGHREDGLLFFFDAA